MFLILDFVTSTNVDNHTHLKGMQKQKNICRQKQTYKNMQENATSQITQIDDSRTLIAFKYVHSTEKDTN